MAIYGYAFAGPIYCWWYQYIEKRKSILDACLLALDSPHYYSRSAAVEALVDGLPHREGVFGSVRLRATVSRGLLHRYIPPRR